MQQAYDVVIIGAGSGGLTAAVGFSKIGKSVLLIEREHMGGECTNSGCIPSKALLHHAKEFYRAKQVMGESAEGEAFRAHAFTYVRSIIKQVHDEETAESFADLGIDVVMGEAVFQSRCSVKVGDTVYEYKNAIIATGSSPRQLNIPGAEDEHILTNQNLFALQNIPERTLIIGSGPIGLEMGQALALLGSKVTIATIDVEFGQLEDPAIRPLLRQSLEQSGVTIETNAFIQSAEAGKAVFDRKKGETVTDTFSVPFDKILVAIGRTPNFPKGLDKAGIQFDERCVLVDRQYRTSNKYVYAVGDVAQKLKFTHTADDTARQVVAHVASRGLLRVQTNKAVPKVTYTDPEVAQVGYSWEEANTRYRTDALMRIEVPFSKVDRATTDNTNGHLVVVARRLTGTVLGAHIIGPRAGELISIFSLAIDEKISLWRLQKHIFAYPTYALVAKKTGDQFVATQIGTLQADLLAVLKRHAPKLIAGLFWIILLYSFHTYRSNNDLSYLDVLWQLLDFFTSSLWGPVVYMMVYAFRPLILFPATLLTALSGTLFGFWWGVAYTLIGENASANLAYVIGRFFGRDLRLEDSLIGNWIQALRRNSFEAVLLMRLFYVPFDLTNYGSGVVQAKWSSYFWATVIGILPGVLTFVALGAGLDLEAFRENGISADVFDPRFILLSVIIFITSLGLSRVLKRWKAATE